MPPEGRMLLLASCHREARLSVQPQPRPVRRPSPTRRSEGRLHGRETRAPKAREGVATPQLGWGGSWVLSPCLTHLGGAWGGPSGGEWRGTRPAGRWLGSGASPAHTRRSRRRPRPEANAEPGNCRGGEPTFAPTARTRPPLPAEVTRPAAEGGGPRCQRWGWGGGAVGVALSPAGLGVAQV